MFMGRKHLQAHLLPEARAARAQLSETGHAAFDGFLPIVINFNGYSMIIVLIYGHPSLGMRGLNKTRFSRLGGLLQATRLPRAIVGDFNAPPEAVKASLFAQGLSGVVRTAPGGG
eukprot:8060852-Pyramimonas_sp.AAC.1